MNDLYSRKNLSKFQEKVLKDTQCDRKAACDKLKKSFKICQNGGNSGLNYNSSHKIIGTNSKNSKYLKTNGWMSRKRNTSLTNTGDKEGSTGFKSRRASNKI
uniref:Uncharacterized protein n=1 Tax=Euplotes crassus TaxID=5936 RepID=A0A7S3KPA6_EUPCR|mmetsp:Transcript_3411/g.3160  ORF Transcript_3411/g.3160 Transcript_3411/m.3160 type:complete len:102 (+) Transcript_3411:817-1122(+)